MFTAGSRAYFSALSTLGELDAHEARRLLSTAYADLLGRRVGAVVREDNEGVAEGLRYLRRLLTAVETSLFRLPSDASELRVSAAFVAAESAYLLARVLEQRNTESATRVYWCSEPTLRDLESALLYAIARHDSNARIVSVDLRRRTGEGLQIEPGSASRFFSAATSLLAQDLSAEAPPADPVDGASTEELARNTAFHHLAEMVISFRSWLLYSSPDRAEFDDHLTTLEAVLGALSARHPDVGHTAALLVLALESFAERALRSIADETDEGPADPFLVAYVENRVNSRPLLWPPASEFVQSCLVSSDRRSAVVAVPTGSGKGSLAEVAVADALTRGWIAYLVPTNALANQVRQDLREVFGFDRDVRVQAFFGGQEYTELSRESAVSVPGGTVAVMTPEKCALGLRRSPGAFENLSLLVVDECHLLGEPGFRGVDAELVVSHVLAEAPEAQVLMMSALLENPEELADWLSSVTGEVAVPIASAWRPTRTLRGFVGYEARLAQANASVAADRLRELPARRVNERFESPYAALVGLQGVWDTDQDRDYLVLELPQAGPLQVSRDRRAPARVKITKPSRWLNTSTARLSRFLAERGERVLAFLPRSRHDPFVVADLIGELPAPETDSRAGPLVEAHLKCAEYELGTKSDVKTNLSRGVAVHSSAMLDAEKNASETAFQSGVSCVMVATGTLAQGLNLPATVVVSAGTNLAGGRVPAGAERLRRQVLNALGRAGRAEFANHGVALVIPDEPIAIAGPESHADARRLADFLADEDTSVRVDSQIGSFLRLLARDGLPELSALTLEEMAAISYLPLDEGNASRADILRRSFGAFQASDVLSAGEIDILADRLARLGRSYVTSAQVPEWTRDVAYRAGLPLPLTFAIFHALAQIRPAVAADQPGSIAEWTEIVLQVLKELPVPMVTGLLWSDSLLSATARSPGGYEFSDAFAAGAPLSDRGWEVIESATRLYASGATISEIAHRTLNLEGSAELDSGRTAGTKPIPKTLFLTRRLADRLSLLAGAVAAIFSIGAASSDEQAWGLDERPNDTLQSLPIGLRTGCGTQSSLSWFRFGLRYRGPAHLLGSIFPVPDGIEGDDAASEWIGDTRRAWLRGDLVPGQVVSEDEAAVLTAVGSLLRRP